MADSSCSPPKELRVPVLSALTGERLAELSASPDDTVEGLGRAAAVAAGLDVNVRLVHRGRVLANSDTVAEAGIADHEHLLAVASRRQRNIQSMIEVYERAERLNACFMVDCTGSMRPHLEAVKDQIHSIVAEMYARLPCMQLRLSFLGYRDIGDGTRFEILPFTTSVDEFQGFVAQVRARGGGGDGPEDVHGAVEQAAAMDWAVGDAATRVLIHIADHPAHGRRYNDSPRDHYPDGDPYGLDLVGLMEKLRAQDVQYVFGHITDHTRKMVRVLNEELGDYIDTKEMQDVGQVAEAVTSTLHSSVASTVSTLSRGGRVAMAQVEFSAELPDWGIVPAQQVIVRSCLPVASVEDLHPGADPSRTRIATEVQATVQLAPLPFSQGESRLARHAVMDGYPAVAKHFKRTVNEIVGDEEGDTSGQDEDTEEDPHLTLSEISAVALFLADAFSACRPEGPKVSFIASDAGRSCADGTPFNIESVLPVAEFRRFSNNVGWWEPDVPETLMHFARWTHVATRGHMMVADLQGVCVSGGFLLTDPCVLCDDVTRFGTGNLGPYAIERSLTALARRLDPVPARLPDPAKPVAVPANAWKPAATAAVAPYARGAVPLDLDGLIHQLLTAPRTRATVQIAEGQIAALLVAARDVFLRQPSLLELDAPISIMGDIHGQFPDLLRFFDANGHPPDTNLLMLGDYVDRGRQSVEVICLLLAYKVKYPENVFLLRGNHECASINRIYGFYDECKRRYNIKLWKRFTDVFNCLPPAALISDKILCMHGGISPELSSLEQVRNIARPSDIPDSGLLCDLLWSDPDKDIRGFVENDRGVSYMFGPDALDSFNKRLGLDLVVRAHQVVEDGYEFFADRSLVTLFSAPNYCGEFDNAGGLMRIHDDLLCSFKVLKPANREMSASRTGAAKLVDA